MSPIYGRLEEKKLSPIQALLQTMLAICVLHPASCLNTRELLSTVSETGRQADLMVRVPVCMCVCVYVCIAQLQPDSQVRPHPRLKAFGTSAGFSTTHG